MEEKDIYRELSGKLIKVFGRETLLEESLTQSEIMMMVENLVKSQGLENVTEDHLQGIKEIMDGEHDIAFHMTGFSNLYHYLK